MSEPTLKKVQLVINKMTKETFDQLSASGQLDNDQLYLLPDEEDYKPIWGNITGVLEHQQDLTGWVALSVETLESEIGSKTTQIDEAKPDKDKVSISYDSTTKKITLDVDTISSFVDASDFIKDGMVESARFDAPSKKIIITFNTDAGKTPISVDVAALVHEYTAGNGLQLSSNQFSIDNTVATKQYVEDALQPYAKEQDIPTKVSQLENDSGFLSAHQSLSAYAKKSEIPTKVSQLANDAGYLSAHQSLSEYAKKEEIPTVNDATITIRQGGSVKGTFTLNQENDLTVDLSVGGGGIDPESLSSYALSADVDKRLESYATQASLDTKVGDIEDALKLKADKSELSVYAKKDNVKISYDSASHIITLSADGVNSTIDASDFIKDGMVESASYDADAKKIIISFNTDAGKTPISVDVAGMVHQYTAGTGLNLNGSQFSVDTTTIATQEYATTAATGALQDAEQYTDGKIAQLVIPTKVSELENDVGYLSAHQSLSEYATQQWVNNQGFLKEHQSLTAYALKSEIPSVGNGSITIKQGNDVKGTFTLNQSSNLTVELSAGGGSGGGGTWGSITGQLSDQTDLTSYIEENVTNLAQWSPVALVGTSPSGDEVSLSVLSGATNAPVGSFDPTPVTVEFLDGTQQVVYFLTRS